MHPDFLSEFRNFLNQQEIEYTQMGSLFYISKPEITIRLVVLNDYSDSLCFSGVAANITLYEDEWLTKFSLITNRLLANLGRQKSIFARSCNVRSISTDEAKEFLDKNHILGYTKGRYKFGLVCKKSTDDVKKDDIVAVAIFSEPRPMDREGIVVQSYEWVRYASHSNYRVVGGMGKLMSHFVEKQNPQEIMTYADKDWGDGDVYKKLGFAFNCETDPITFMINKKTYKRVTEKKILSDHNDTTQEELSEEYYRLRNQGNLKFLWRSTFIG